MGRDARDARSAVEAEAQPIERRSQTPRRPPLRSAAARRLRVSWITALRSGSGGNGTGRRRTSSSAARLGRAAVEQVERDPRAEAAGADAEARCSRARRRRGRRARVPKNTEKRLQVSIAPPQRWREAHALELREVREEVLREPREGRLVVVELRADRAAVAVDGVVAAPEDAVVGAQPVVVELVAAVADSLARASSRSSRAGCASSGSVISA